MTAKTTEKVSMLPSILFIGILCVTAIIAQSFSLFGLVRYVTNRETWESQKAQYAAVSSEWEQMSQSETVRVEQIRQNALLAESQKASALKELEEAQEKLATAQGELAALSRSTTVAVEKQRQAQADEQASRDAITKLKTELSDLNKQKITVQNQIESNGKLLETVQTRFTNTQASLENLESELKRNEQKRRELDDSFKTARDNLLKTSDELLTANEDLTGALRAKKEVVVATDAATALAKEVEKLKSEKSNLAGELAALSMQKQDLEKEIATSDSRMSVARAKLAEYLDKWNNREKLSQEVDEIAARVVSLKKTESDTNANITRLTDQSVKLESKTKSLSEEIKAAESELKDLKTKQKELLADLIELQKLKAEADGTPGKKSVPGDKQ
jgi:chromosome segregation ATPase